MREIFKPDKSFFRYLKTEYAKEVYGYGQYKFNDQLLDLLLKASYAVTAFLKSKQGAKVAFAISGVEEVYPHVGFKYVHEKTQKLVPDLKKLRIFRKVEEERIELSIEGLGIIRKVHYAENWYCPSEDIIVKVFRHYRNWLSTGIGQTWIDDNFKAIDYLRHSRGVAYRYETGDGRVYWFDNTDIVAKPNPLNRCHCCDGDYPCCDNYSGMGAMCNRCYSEHFAEPETLKSCARHECKEYRCENYITENQFHEIVEDPGNIPIQWTASG